jgi:RNA polymerase sigma-70 factor (ECF subfamily)
VDVQRTNMPLTDQPPKSGAGESTLERARRGDLAAFGELVNEHEPRVFSIALRFTGRRADAEELTQDVFVQLHGALKQMTDDRHLRRWLLRTTTHRCLNRLRDDKRRPRTLPFDAVDIAAEAAAPERESDPLLGARLRRLLLDLNPHARAVMLLRFQEDLDPAEIATVLAMSINTVKSHLRRSLEWLRAQCAGDDHGT